MSSVGQKDWSGLPVDRKNIGVCVCVCLLMCSCVCECVCMCVSVSELCVCVLACVYTHRNTQSIMECCTCHHRYHTCSLTDITIAWACVYVSRGKGEQRTDRTCLEIRLYRDIEKRACIQTHVAHCMFAHRQHEVPKPSQTVQAWCTHTHG